MAESEATATGDESEAGSQSDAPKKGVPVDVLTVAIIWAVFTIILEVLATLNYLPTQGAEEAEISDTTFRVLTFMGIPVITFVYTVVVYSFIRFRAKSSLDDDEVEDGAGFASNKRVSWVWLVVTAALAITSIFYPGLAELSAFEGDRRQDLEIDIQALQFNWLVTYADEEITIAGPNDAIVLPVDRRVKFNLTSNDVNHSFWVPAFRTKIDAVPGRDTSIRVTPTETGGFPENSLYRLQCAELCGVGHSIMRMPIKVVEQDEFEEWVEEQQE